MPCGPGVQVSTPRSPRRGSASCSARALSRPVVCCSASQRTPSIRSKPSTWSTPGPAGVGVDQAGRPRPRAHQRQGAGEGGGATPPGTTHHPHRHPVAGRSLAGVGEQLQQPGVGARQLGDVLRADPDRRLEDVVGHPAPARRSARDTRRGGPRSASSAATSTPTSTTGAADQLRSAPPGSGATSGVTPAAAVSRSSSSSRVSSRVMINGEVMRRICPPATTYGVARGAACGRRPRGVRLCTNTGSQRLGRAAPT